MIAITYTHRNGVEQLEPVTIAIDPEKIVSIRDRGAYAEIEYGETFDKRRQPVTYQLTASRANIDATILGTYEGKENLAVTVLDSNDANYRPYNRASYVLELQERYIVDIRESYHWINLTKTACRRIEYVPGAFVPVILWVSTRFADMITDTPEDATTTTEEPETTTTTTPELQ